MTETGPENTTEPRLDAATGHSAAFLKGLVGGALIGTAAGVIFAPGMYAVLRNLRRQLTDAAADAGDGAWEGNREVTTRVADSGDDLQRQDREAYGKALSVVLNAAEQVEDRVTEALTDLEEIAADAPTRSSS
jgi:gas vesicle protein